MTYYKGVFMLESYQHFITKNIKSFYTRRLFSPTIYIILLIALWFIFPIHHIVSPANVDSSTFIDSYKSDKKYVKGNFYNLHFTGYTEQLFGKTVGYYYYTMRQDRCAIVLLSPSTCEEGLPSIDHIKTKGKLIKTNENYAKLIEKMAKDLQWTSVGLSTKAEKYYFSEPDFHKNFANFLLLFYFGSFIYAAGCLILYLLFIKFPFFAPPCQNLIVFGNPKKILEEAEEELATLPQLATEDMFITEHYFILTSPYGNAIVPIKEILWIYKYSTLHKFLWYHFSISYTLHITANKHLFIHCPKNIKSDIDGIIDYLSEANHDILVGFNENNRLKVQKIQGKPLHIEKWIAFLRRKI